MSPNRQLLPAVVQHGIYGWQKLNMGQTAERISVFRNERNFEEGMRFAERSLQKYPNSFDVVYESSLLYFMSMIHYRGKSAQRAIELLERAIELIDQNTDETVGVITIQNQIASCYCYLGNIEKAVDVLKQNNIGGLNDAKLSYTNNIVKFKFLNQFLIYVPSVRHANHTKQSVDLLTFLLRIRIVIRNGVVIIYIAHIKQLLN